METTQKVTYERQGRHILFTVSKSVIVKMNIGATVDTAKGLRHIMEENGYHPAAYGQPYDIVDKGDTIEFKCSSSSD